MFKNKHFQQFLAWCWYYLFEYFRTFLFPEIKKSFVIAKDKFLENLWDSIKDDIHEHAAGAVAYVHQYIESPNYEVREKVAMDAIFNKIKLPIPLKPFKALLKHIFKQKIRDLISEGLKKVDTII